MQIGTPPTRGLLTLALLAAGALAAAACGSSSASTPSVTPRASATAQAAGFGGRGGNAGAALRLVSAAAAEVIGVAPSDLTAQIRSGQSIEQVAQQHGITADDLKTRIIANVKSRLDQQVAAESITSQQESMELQRLHAGIDAALTRMGLPFTPGAGPFGTPGAGRRFRQGTPPPSA